MKRTLILVVVVAAIAAGAMFNVANSTPRAAAAVVAPPVPSFRLDFHGTAGVKVHMLLITKPIEAALPERREETITLPAKIDFHAARCFAWIDTLPNGASGNEGDKCEVNLIQDGHTTSTCTTTMKKPSHETLGLGNL